MRGPKFYLALWASKAAACAIDIIAKGRGTNLPGAVALKIDPHFLEHIRGIDPEKTVFITGTNGKSTTTNILNRILTEAGYRVLSNLDGANMTAGVAVPLLKSCSLLGKVKCDYVVMETDERYVARIRKQIPGRYLGITNIQKDQVQRNGEPSFIAEKIREAMESDMNVFLNYDDPNAMSLSSSAESRFIRYGVTSHPKSFNKHDDFFAVTMPCPKCHSGIEFLHYNQENIGSYYCPVCGFANQRGADYLTTDVSFKNREFTLNGTTYPYLCNLPEFLYSYTLATSIALEFGVKEQVIVSALAGYDKDAGRGETHKIGTKQVKFFRIKQENSETLQSALNSISTDETPKTLIFGLDEYIDFYPPYINGCYMFDCSFGNLRDSGVERCICTAPALGECGALRFLYDGFEPASVSVIPDSLEPTLAQALEQKDCDNVYLIEEIPFWKR